MCLAPNNLPEVGLVACRNCWQCRKARVDDLVGRCIAESHHATKALAVTLTYGDDAADHSSVLVYADFQKFMKRLRRKGYTVRYIVTGEYGSKFDRSHWHAILFFYGKYPEAVSFAKDRKPWQVFYPRRKDDPLARIDWAPWEHGFSWIEEPSYKAFRYVLKYALKQEDQDVSVGHLAMSKKPPLGDAYFRQLAADHVAQGTVPASYFYSFPDVLDAKGRPRQFMMQGVTRDNFLYYYLEGWAERNGLDWGEDRETLIIGWSDAANLGEAYANDWLHEETDRLYAQALDLQTKAAVKEIGNRLPPLPRGREWDEFRERDPEGFRMEMQRMGYWRKDWR